MIQEPRFALRGLAAAVSLALAACAAFPEQSAVPQAKPVGQYPTDASFSGPARQWPTESWWEGYGDPQLGVLIREALAGSPTIADAEARLRRAQAIVQVSDAATVP